MGSIVTPMGRSIPGNGKKTFGMAKGTILTKVNARLLALSRMTINKATQ